MAINDGEMKFASRLFLTHPVGPTGIRLVHPRKVPRLHLVIENNPLDLLSLSSQPSFLVMVGAVQEEVMLKLGRFCDTPVVLLNTGSASGDQTLSGLA